MPWYDLVPTAGNEQTLARARKALGRRTVYDLGAGGMDPTRGLDRLCDCSGFVAWAIGIPRQLPPKSGGWLDTDAYHAGGGAVFPGLLSAVAAGKAQPGDIVVYPDYKQNGKRRQGHMGIVSQVDAQGKPSRVIHCSVSNSNRGDAVQETPPTAWNAHAATSRVMRVDYAALRSRYAPGHAPEPVAVAAPAKQPLQHPLLAGEAVLQAIAAGTDRYLRPTGGPVPGMGAVQDALNRLAAKYPEYGVSYGSNRGAYGPRTEQAVKNFQASHRIEPDGFVGKNTLRALDAALRSFDANGVDKTRATPPNGGHVPAGDARRIFIQQIAPGAQASAKATGVPASITIAQAALESNWGKSLLAVDAKNFFGIKGKGPAGSVKMPTLEWIDGKFVKVKADFRAYESLEQSIDDHARHIATARWKTGIPIYREAMKHTQAPRKFAAALEGVYATDPDYAEKLWRVMDQYELEKFDVPA
jgi:flagellum-specific peptidoglycan hydrolase FlgJ